MEIPYLERSEIRSAARRLRDRAFDHPNPVPVDVEALLFDFLYAEHDLAFFNDEPLGDSARRDVLGVTYPLKNEIHVDGHLADEGHTGRYRFTVAHEIGHWVLHRPLFLEAAEPDAPSDRWDDTPRLVTLERDVVGSDEDDDDADRSYRPEEWQANVFAIWLLLPDGALRREFERRFGEPSFEPPPIARAPEADSPLRPASRALAATAKDDHSPLHESFLLSVEATAIAMEERGYIANK